MSPRFIIVPPLLLVLSVIEGQTFADFEVMPALPEAPPVPSDNPMTPAKVALGKQLYFDPRLSVNGAVSCNSCHDLATAGVDHEALSTGALRL